jgi:hypothetical protein
MARNEYKSVYLYNECELINKNSGRYVRWTVLARNEYKSVYLYNECELINKNSVICQVDSIGQKRVQICVLVYRM